MGELTGISKQIIYGRIDRNLDADYIWAIIYRRVDRNVDADYLWAN